MSPAISVAHCLETLAVHHRRPEFVPMEVGKTFLSAPLRCSCRLRRGRRSERRTNWPREFPRLRSRTAPCRSQVTRDRFEPVFLVGNRRRQAGRTVGRKARLVPNAKDLYTLPMSSFAVGEEVPYSFRNFLATRVGGGLVCEKEDSGGKGGSCNFPLPRSFNSKKVA